MSPTSVKDDLSNVVKIILTKTFIGGITNWKCNVKYVLYVWFDQCIFWNISLLFNQNFLYEQKQPISPSSADFLWF